MNEQLAYSNGQWIPQDQLQLSIDDLGFLLGVTIVERLRTFGGRVFRLDEHLRRLGRSLDVVGWETKQLVSEVAGAIQEFPERNAHLFVPGDDWAVVAFVTPGKSPDAAEPTVCVHGHPLTFAEWAPQFRNGVELVVANTRQVPANCWPPELKCRSRLHYYQADREAGAKVPGARGLLLDQDGFVGEGTTANVVMYQAERGLVTPLRDKVLPGVSQQVMFELADTLKIRHAEADITLDQLKEAEEVYLTSTSICMLPVVKIDSRPVGQGTPGPIYDQFLAAWSNLVGVDIAAQAERFAQRDQS